MERRNPELENVPERLREEAWSFWEPELEGLLTTPVAELPCAITPDDVTRLEACLNHRRPLPGRSLSRPLWLFLLRRLNAFRYGMDAARFERLATVLFEEGCSYEGVPLYSSYPARERALEIRKRLNAQGRTFDRLEDFEEWFRAVFAEAIKSLVLSGDGEWERMVADETCRNLDLGRPIQDDRAFRERFALVYQVTVFHAAHLMGGDPYGALDRLEKAAFG